MTRLSKIYVAGHRGLVGSAIMRCLERSGYESLVTRTHAELDLEDRPAVDAFFAEERPEFVFLAAAKVGGIHANDTYPVDFLLRNLNIQNNVIHAAWRNGVKGLIFLGSSCIYPKLAPQPLREEYLLTGPLEPTNEPYAVAKIAGIELCEAFNRQYGTRFLSVMPTNLYGPNDRYDLEKSHVLPALIRKFHLARMASQGKWDAVSADERFYGGIPRDILASLVAIARAHGHGPPPWLRELPDGWESVRPAVRLWGTGGALREFLYADDVGWACVFLMERLGALFDKRSEREPGGDSARAARSLFNIGCGRDLTIRELAEKIARVVGCREPVEWDADKPDGTPRKLLDASRMRELGWEPAIGLEEGLRLAYRDYLARADLPADRNTQE
jgi:GDP-L-fucose synthase